MRNIGAGKFEQEGFAVARLDLDEIAGAKIMHADDRADVRAGEIEHGAADQIGTVLREQHTAADLTDLVAGPAGSLKKAIGVTKGKDAAVGKNGPLNTQIDKADKSKDLWFAVALTPDMKKNMGKDPETQSLQGIRGSVDLAVELDRVRVAGAGLESLDDHQPVVMAGHAKGRRGLTEHPDFTGAVGLDPDRRFRLVNEPLDRAEDQPGQGILDFGLMHGKVGTRMAGHSKQRRETGHRFFKPGNHHRV